MLVFVLNGSYHFRINKIESGLLMDNLNHSLNELVDLVLAITEITTFNKVIVLLAPSACWCV